MSDITKFDAVLHRLRVACFAMQALYGEGPGKRRYRPSASAAKLMWDSANQAFRLVFMEVLTTVSPRRAIDILAEASELADLAAQAEAQLLKELDEDLNGAEEDTGEPEQGHGGLTLPSANTDTGDEH
jgi:hypothetical protein